MNGNELYTLACWIAGDFSNREQAFADPKTYAHIRVFFRPLPFEFFSGVGFYSEQTYDHDLWTPYRQGVHRFVDRNDCIYIENYALQDSIVFAGAGRDRNILTTIGRDVIARRYHCSMVFKRDGNKFHGSVEPGKQCFIERNGHKTYLASDVELTENTLETWDRGMDPETDAQVWGSAAGPLFFEKTTSFADEVPSF